MITRDQLKAICPTIKESNLEYAELLTELMPKWGVIGLAIPAFIAQIAHESGAFNYVKEIASGEEYDTRVDLGNTPEKDGDGAFFKGRGLIQITGKNNYKAVSLALFGDLRLLKNPEILEQKRYAVESALWYWKTRGLTDIMNKPPDWVIVWPKTGLKSKARDKFEWVTIKINGGVNGLEDRKKYYNRALSVLK